MLPSSLTVSVVTYRPDVVLLERCLRKLALAIGAAREAGAIRSVAIALIDNSEDRAVAAEVIELGRTRFADSGVQVHYLHGHANIGYGAAHNLVLHGTGADYQLVLNPDVELAPDALANAVRWLDAHPDVGALAPAVTQRATASPSTCASAIRRCSTCCCAASRRASCAGCSGDRLDRYEMRDRIDPDGDEPVLDVPVMSGACMLVKRDADRRHRRLRPEVLPLLRGLRLERAARPG